MNKEIFEALEKTLDTAVILKGLLKEKPKAEKAVLEPKPKKKYFKKKETNDGTPKTESRDD